MKKIVFLLVLTLPILLFGCNNIKPVDSSSPTNTDIKTIEDNNLKLNETKFEDKVQVKNIDIKVEEVKKQIQTDTNKKSSQKQTPSTKAKDKSTNNEVDRDKNKPINNKSAISKTKDKLTTNEAVIDKNKPINNELSISKTKTATKSNLIITVVGQGPRAKIEVFEKSGGVWAKVMSTTGFVGKNGVTYSKKEGDGKTPAGSFSITQAFGVNANPGTSLAYRKVTDNDFWVDDVNSSFYNSWQVGPADGRWNSAEHLIKYPTQYKYGAIINYNTDRVKGKGSAIFLHCSTGRGTAGCVSTSESNMIKILKLMNPNKKTHIIIAPSEDALLKY